MDRPTREPGIASLAGAVLEQALRDASEGRHNLTWAAKQRNLYAWAVLPPAPADEAYVWLLSSAHLWLNILGIEPDYFGRIAYEAVEERRRHEALARCRRVGFVLEALARRNGAGPLVYRAPEELGR